MAEQKLPKLTTRVRFPSPAPTARIARPRRITRAKSIQGIRSQATDRIVVPGGRIWSAFHTGFHTSGASTRARVISHAFRRNRARTALISGGPQYAIATRDSLLQAPQGSSTDGCLRVSWRRTSTTEDSTICFVAAKPRSPAMNLASPDSALGRMPSTSSASHPSATVRTRPLRSCTRQEA